MEKLYLVKLGNMYVTSASLTSIKQNVPWATVSILFTVALENGSQFFHNSEKLKLLNVLREMF